VLGVGRFTVGWNEIGNPTSPLGIIDSYGIELIHPIREGRSKESRIAGSKKGKSNHRWIVGCKLCLAINQFGLITARDCDTANMHNTTFQPLIQLVSRGE
jgi:hypothetical protein